MIGFQIFKEIIHDADVLPYSMNIRVSQLLFLGDLGHLLFWKGDTVRSNSDVQGADARVAITSCEVGFVVSQGRRSVSGQGTLTIVQLHASGNYRVHSMGLGDLRLQLHVDCL